MINRSKGVLVAYIGKWFPKDSENKEGNDRNSGSREDSKESQDRAYWALWSDSKNPCTYVAAQA